GGPGLGQLRVPQVAVAVSDADQAELLQVARDRRLRRVEAELRELRPDLLLTAQRLVANELEERALPLSLHPAPPFIASASDSPNAATKASTDSASTESGGVARTTLGPASVARNPRAISPSTTTRAR